MTGHPQRLHDSNEMPLQTGTVQEEGARPDALKQDSIEGAMVRGLTDFRKAIHAIKPPSGSPSGVIPMPWIRARLSGALTDMGNLLETLDSGNPSLAQGFGPGSTEVQIVRVIEALAESLRSDRFFEGVSEISETMKGAHADALKAFHRHLQPLLQRLKEATAPEENSDLDFNSLAALRRLETALDQHAYQRIPGYLLRRKSRSSNTRHLIDFLNHWKAEIRLLGPNPSRSEVIILTERMKRAVQFSRFIEGISRKDRVPRYMRQARMDCVNALEGLASCLEDSPIAQVMILPQDPPESPLHTEDVGALPAVQHNLTVYTPEGTLPSRKIDELSAQAYIAMDSGKIFLESSQRIQNALNASSAEDEMVRTEDGALTEEYRLLFDGEKSRDESLAIARDLLNSHASIFASLRESIATLHALSSLLGTYCTQETLNLDSLTANLNAFRDEHPDVMDDDFFEALLNSLREAYEEDAHPHLLRSLRQAIFQTEADIQRFAETLSTQQAALGEIIGSVPQLPTDSPQTLEPHARHGRGGGGGGDDGGDGPDDPPSEPLESPEVSPNVLSRMKLERCDAILADVRSLIPGHLFGGHNYDYLDRLIGSFESKIEQLQRDLRKSPDTEIPLSDLVELLNWTLDPDVFSADVRTDAPQSRLTPTTPRYVQVVHRKLRSLLDVLDAEDSESLHTLAPSPSESPEESPLLHPEDLGAYPTFLHNQGSVRPDGEMIRLERGAQSLMLDEGAVHIFRLMKELRELASQLPSLTTRIHIKETQIRNLYDDFSKIDPSSPKRLGVSRQLSALLNVFNDHQTRAHRFIARIGEIQIDLSKHRAIALAIWVGISNYLESAQTEGDRSALRKRLLDAGMEPYVQRALCERLFNAPPDTQRQLLDRANQTHGWILSETAVLASIQKTLRKTLSSLSDEGHESTGARPSIAKIEAEISHYRAEQFFADDPSRQEHLKEVTKLVDDSNLPSLKGIEEALRQAFILQYGPYQRLVDQFLDQSQHLNSNPIHLRDNLIGLVTTFQVKLNAFLTIRPEDDDEISSSLEPLSDRLDGILQDLQTFHLELTPCIQTLKEALQTFGTSLDHSPSDEAEEAVARVTSLLSESITDYGPLSTAYREAAHMMDSIRPLADEVSLPDCKALDRLIASNQARLEIVQRVLDVMEPTDLRRLLAQINRLDFKANARVVVDPQTNAVPDDGVLRVESKEEDYLEFLKHSEQDVKEGDTADGGDESVDSVNLEDAPTEELAPVVSDAAEVVPIESTPMDMLFLPEEPDTSEEPAIVAPPPISLSNLRPESIIAPPPVIRTDAMVVAHDDAEEDGVEALSAALSRVGDFGGSADEVAPDPSVDPFDDPDDLLLPEAEGFEGTDFDSQTTMDPMPEPFIEKGSEGSGVTTAEPPSIPDEEGQADVGAAPIATRKPYRSGLSGLLRMGLFAGAAGFGATNAHLDQTFSPSNLGGMTTIETGSDLHDAVNVYMFEDASGDSPSEISFDSNRETGTDSSTQNEASPLTFADILPEGSHEMDAEGLPLLEPVMAGSMWQLPGASGAAPTIVRSTVWDTAHDLVVDRSGVEAHSPEAHRGANHLTAEMLQGLYDAGTLTTAIATRLTNTSEYQRVKTTLEGYGFVFPKDVTTFHELLLKGTDGNAYAMTLFQQCAAFYLSSGEISSAVNGAAPSATVTDSNLVTPDSQTHDFGAILDEGMPTGSLTDSYPDLGGDATPAPDSPEESAGGGEGLPLDLNMDDAAGASVDTAQNAQAKTRGRFRRFLNKLFGR